MTEYNDSPDRQMTTIKLKMEKKRKQSKISDDSNCETNHVHRKGLFVFPIRGTRHEIHSRLIVKMGSYVARFYRSTIITG